MTYTTKDAKITANYAVGTYIDQAGKSYTMPLVQRFEKQYLKREGYKVRSVKPGDVWETIYKENEFIVYKPHDAKAREYTVKIKREDSSIWCECCMFETFGMLCCNCLKVMSTLQEAGGLFDKIPEKYIVKRWTINAKEGLSIKSIDNVPANDRRTQMTRYRSGILEISNRLLAACHSEDSFSAVMDGIRASLTMNEHYMAEPLSKGPIRESVQTNLTVKMKDNQGKGRAKRLISVSKQARQAKQRKIIYENKKGGQGGKGLKDDGLRLSL